MADEVVLPIPNNRLPQCLFILTNPQLTHLHSDARKELLEGIKADRQSIFYNFEENIFDIGYIDMGPYYRIITSASSLLPLDQSLLDSMEKDNEEELKKLDDRLAEAEKIEGESEISDALKARANYLTRIGDKVPISLLV
jgi:26S proteasome regulatory subunit N7